MSPINVNTFPNAPPPFDSFSKFSIKNIIPSTNNKIGIVFIAAPNPLIAIPNLPGSAFLNPSFNKFIELVNFSTPEPEAAFAASLMSSSLSLYFTAAFCASSNSLSPALTLLRSASDCFISLMLLSASAESIATFILISSVSSAIVIYYI